MWRWFSKKYILPIKYYFVKKKIVNELEFRPREEVIQKRTELQNKLLAFQRVSDAKNADVYKSNIELIDWITYAERERG